MNTIIITITLTIILEHHCQATMQSLRNLKDKAKEIKGNVKVMKENRRGTSISFTPRSEILYPGFDMEKKKKINKLWKDYYECQEALYQATLTLVVPEAMGVHEGSNVILDCEVCESPRDMFLDTKWKYTADYNMNSIDDVKYTASLYMNNDSLYISNVQESGGGLYVCQKGNHFARPYMLHVFKEEPSQKVVPEQNNEGEHPAKDAHIPELGVTLTTRWAKWTQCSRCDIIGTRNRQGICTVVADTNLQSGADLENNTNLQSTTQIQNSTNQLGLRQKRRSYQSVRKKVTEATEVNLMNITSNQGVGTQRTLQGSSTESTIGNLIDQRTIGNPTTSPTLATHEFTSKPADIYSNISMRNDLELLKMFEDGIPCRSKLLSVSLRSIGPIANRSSEVLFAYCKISCPKSVMFMVVDENGQVVETANNSEGVYSVLQGLPRELPAVSRTVEFATFNKFFKIQCPGNRNMDVPVEWYVGHKPLTNKILQQETNGRIKIDEYNRITFNPALFEDSRIFSCWQHRKLAGTVRLLVEKKYEPNYQRLVMIVGISVVFVIFLYVFYKAFSLS